MKTWRSLARAWRTASTRVNRSSSAATESAVVLLNRDPIPRTGRVPYVSRFRRRRAPVGQFFAAVAVVAFLSWQEAPHMKAVWTAVATPADEAAATEHSAYFANCDTARAAGVAPISRGEPGYRHGLDGDSDGVACEPFRGRY